jgi:GxxExxY protein
VGDLIHKELAYSVIGAAMEVHRVLGPGFLEEVYQAALERELALRAVPFEQQYHVQVRYKDTAIADYYLDLVVDGKIAVELKAVSQLAPVHDSQVLSYLKASGLRLGLLINFGEQSLRYKRIVL